MKETLLVRVPEYGELSEKKNKVGIILTYMEMLIM